MGLPANSDRTGIDRISELSVDENVGTLTPQHRGKKQKQKRQQERRYKTLYDLVKCEGCVSGEVK